MKKSIFFALFIFAIWGRVNAQYSNDDVRVINVSFEGSPVQVKLSQKHSLHTQVIFRIDIFGMLYGAMRGSQISASGLPPSELYLSKIKALSSDDTIPLAVMALRFDRIPPQYYIVTKMSFYQKDPS